MYSEWIRKVFKIGGQLGLVLHLNPSESEPASGDAVDLWTSTSEDFNTRYSNLKLIVHASSGVFDPTSDIDWREGPVQVLIYDYHRLYVKAFGNLINDGDPDYRPKFYESFTGHHPSQIVIFNPPGSAERRINAALDLTLAAVAKVAVIDERIWNRLKADDRDNLVTEDLRLRGILVPNEAVIDYRHPNAGHATSLERWMKEEGIDILVMHQGILDKIFRNSKSVQEWSDQIKQYVPFVVVASDRGQKHLTNLPRNIRFVQFSSIDPWLTGDHVSKYHLVQTLLSATRWSEDDAAN